MKTFLDFRFLISCIFCICVLAVHAEVDIVTSEVSNSIFVNSDISVCPIFENEIEFIYFDSNWVEYNKDEARQIRISLEHGNEKIILKEVDISEVGFFEFRPKNYPVGCYILRHEIIDDNGIIISPLEEVFDGNGYIITPLEKLFFITDSDKIELHGGLLEKNECWSSNKVHVIYNKIIVPKDVELTVDTGTIVKFVSGTGIDVLEGGCCIAKGAIFTHIYDDSVGGDNFYCDEYHTFPNYDDYVFTGNIIMDSDTNRKFLSKKISLSGIVDNKKTLYGDTTYCVSGELVLAATLTALPGTIIKMNSNSSINIYQSGILNVQGTRLNPVEITSIKDDIGGDTNGDDERTSPQPGDWYQIRLIEGKLNAKYLNIFYSSNKNNEGGLYVTENGVAELDCCTIAHCEYDCYRVYSGGFGKITNSIFYDASLGAAIASGNSEFINCVFCNLTTAIRWSKGSFVNCIFSDIYQSFFDRADSYSVSNSVFWNLEGYGPQNNDLTGTKGNIWGNPLFVDAENGDFRIVEGSSCVDAADTEAAPERDYFGQPRITITNQGTNTAERLADIGICEAMPRNVASDIDLIPQSITSVTNAAPGQKVFIKWEIANVGGRDITGSWRDTISLVSENGSEIELGEKVTTSTIGAGGSVFCSGYFVVPAISEGNYYPKVNVNSYHDIFEGNLTANNALVGDKSINVALESIDPSVVQSDIIYDGEQKVLKLSFHEGDENRMVTFNVPKGVRITWGFGSMPTSGVNYPGFMGSSTANGSSPIQFLVPDGALDVYIILESDETVVYELSSDSTKISLLSVSPNVVPSNGTVTLTITGAGFEDGCVVSFNSGDTHIFPETIQLINQEQLNVTLDCSNFVAGQTYDVNIQINDFTTILEKGVSASSENGEGHFWARLIAPEAVRQGRKATCYIEYGNNGNADVPAEVFQVFIKGDGRISYADSDAGFNSLQFFGAGHANSADIIKSGSSFKIPFTMLCGAENELSLHCSIDSEEFEAPWGDALSYLSDLRYAARKIGNRGGDSTDFIDVLNIAKKVFNNERDVSVYGKLIGFNNQPINNAHLVMLNLISSNRYLTIAKNGHFEFADVEDGDYIISSENINLKNRDITVQVSGEDVSLGTIHAYDHVSIIVSSSATENNYSFQLSSLPDLDDIYLPIASTKSTAIFAGLDVGVYKILMLDDDANIIQTFNVIYTGCVERVELDLPKKVSLDICLPENDVAGSYDIMMCKDYAFYEEFSTNNISKLEFEDISAGLYDFLIVDTVKNHGYRFFLDLDSDITNKYQVILIETNSFLQTETIKKLPNIYSNEIQNNVIFQTDDTRYDNAMAKFFELNVIPISPPPEYLESKHNMDFYNDKIKIRESLKSDALKLAEKKAKYNSLDRTSSAEFWKIPTSVAGPIAAAAGAIYGAAGATVAVGSIVISEGLIFQVVSVGLGLASSAIDKYIYGEEDYFNTRLAIGSAIVFAYEKTAIEASDKLLWQTASKACDILSWFSPGHAMGNYIANKQIADIAGEDYRNHLAEFENILNEYERLSAKEYDTACYKGWNPYSGVLYSRAPEVRISCDPNEISGPFGVGDPETERFVVPGEWLTYTVYFENTSNATAAAQEVYVTNPLNKYLDWTTFEMGEIVFNNQVDLGLVGKASGTCETAMNNSSYQVRTNLELDKKKGVAKWYMRIVDPATETGWPENILDGFLPPNDETYRGEGHLTYRIRLREDAPAGTRINNSATIVFDYNEAIETDPAWWNIVAKMKMVEFDGGSTNINLVVGAKYGELPEPDKQEGKTFIGWFTEPNGSGRQITSETLVGEDDGKLYAFWSANAYTVNYLPNGGEGEVESQSVIYNSEFSLRANGFTYKSHKFVGWGTSEGGEVVYSAGQTVSNLTAVANGVIDLYAVWELWTVDVKFTSFGTETNLTYVVEQPYGMLPAPEISDRWTLLGWFTEPNGGGCQITEETLVEADVEELYAHWHHDVVVLNVSCLQAWPLDRRVIINYTLDGRTNETNSVYSVKFYGTVDSGETFFELGERGELSRDGVTGIVLGEGEHKTLWMPDESLYDVNIDDMQIKVEAEDITESADSE